MEKSKSSKTFQYIDENINPYEGTSHADKQIEEILRKFNGRCDDCGRKEEQCICGLKYNIKKDKWELEK